MEEMARDGRVVAVVGTGSIGMRHLRILRDLVGLRPAAIPVRPGRVADLEAAGYVAVQDLDQAVALGADRCIVATDTGRHVDDGLAAVARGLDVLVEKPLAPNAEEAHRLWKGADAAGRKLHVGCVMRFSESLGVFRELLPRVGAVHSVRIECQSYLPNWRPARPHRDAYSARRDEGGALRDLIHEIDYAGWVFGWPGAVSARLRNLGRLGIEAEETVDLMWEASGGGVVSMTLDYLSRPPRRRMRAAGEWGTVEWDAVAEEVVLTTVEGPPTVVRSSQSRDEMFREQALVFTDPYGRVDPRLATGDDGVRALAVCDAARRSSESRREEAVRYP